MNASSLTLNASPVAVLVSVRVDPVSGRATRSRADAAGAALALQALQARAALQGRSPAAQPRLLHVACRQSATASGPRRSRATTWRWASTGSSGWSWPTPIRSTSPPRWPKPATTRRW
jgi:type II secretory pathway pseudopilin PulG